MGGLKRFREQETAEELEDDTVATANCLMLLSRVGEATDKPSAGRAGERVFECKTCNKQFHSFQALGGHRASHKKLRLMAADFLNQALPAKHNSHVCSICGLEFSMGQALGGHMRRHRPATMDREKVVALEKSDTKPVPILIRSNSRSKRIFGFDVLDLNLTPDENDSKPHSIPPLLDFLHLTA